MEEHEHSWEAVTEVIHHEAQTEEVYIVDTEAWDETVETVTVVETEKCECRCGAIFDTAEEQWAHAQSFDDDHFEEHAGWTSVIVTEEVRTAEIIHHPEEGHYESRTLVEAYDETVVSGFVCTVCGDFRDP